MTLKFGIHHAWYCAIIQQKYNSEKFDRKKLQHLIHNTDSAKIEITELFVRRWPQKPIFHVLKYNDMTFAANHYDIARKQKKT